MTRIRTRTCRHLGRCLGLAVALAVSPLLQAQTSPPAPRPDPLDAGATVPPAVHASTLARFKSAREVPVGSWREANETVNRIGGWRAYSREAHAPQPASSAPGAAPGHGGHAPRGGTP